MSFANSEIMPKIGAWTRPLINLEPYNKKNVETAQQDTLKAMAVLKKHLLLHTFLVGERITLADIFTAGTLYRGFQNVSCLFVILFFRYGKLIFSFQVSDKEWRKGYPNITRWYETVHNQPIYSAVAGTPKFIDEAVK